MGKIVVFDSGLGSLSIIKEIQKLSKLEIIYFGDQKNFPYGKKSKVELDRIIRKTIARIKENFSPDLIVVGSNTPTILLDLETRKIIGVKPPLKEAARITRTGNIGILGTESAIQSKELRNFIKDCNLDSKIKIHKMNGSPLVELVESGRFLTNKLFCKKEIRNNLKKMVMAENIDVITLSSTHLPFLRSILEEEFPNVKFLDPASLIAKKVHNKMKNNQEEKNKLKIFTSGNLKVFQKNLLKLGIRNKPKAFIA